MIIFISGSNLINQIATMVYRFIRETVQVQTIPPPGPSTLLNLQVHSIVHLDLNPEANRTCTKIEQVKQNQSSEIAYM